MPYHLEQRDKKTCVVKGHSGQKGPTVACHDSREQAERHMRALYRNVKDASIDAEESEQLALVAASTNFAPIRLYFQEGERTPDRRVVDPNAVNYDRPPPWPLRIQFAQPESGGHAGAIICGVLDRAVRDNLTHVFEGRIDLGSAAGREALRLIESGIMSTWSPDLGDLTVDIEIGVEDEDGANPQEELAHFVKATFLGATLVAMPALASAVVELLNDDGSVRVPAPKRENLIESVEAPAALPTAIDVANPQRIIDRTDTPSPIAACAGPSAPPSSFFTDPQLSELQRHVTITSDGRIYGHAAGFDECHIGFLDRCITIRDIADCNGEGNFEYAMPGHVVCADGTRVSTGPLAVKGGHASKSAAWKQALSHYDDPDAAAADVVYGMDRFGVWFSGAIRPSTTEHQVRVLRASGVSLDARQIDGKLRYLATCAVNTPGFPKVRLAASGEIEALIAAGGLPIGTCLDCEDEEEDMPELSQRIDALEKMTFDTFDSRIGAPDLTDISDVEALQAAISSVSLSSDPDAAKRLLKARARDLKRSDLIPSEWANDTDMELAFDEFQARIS